MAVKRRDAKRPRRVQVIKMGISENETERRYKNAKLEKECVQSDEYDCFGKARVL